MYIIIPEYTYVLKYKYKHTVHKYTQVQVQCTYSSTSTNTNKLYTQVQIQTHNESTKGADASVHVHILLTKRDKIYIHYTNQFVNFISVQKKSESKRQPKRSRGRANNKGLRYLPKIQKSSVNSKET